MDLPMSRASAFLRRNRTTHSWYGDWSSAGCIMSTSCPSPQTLEQHMRNARKAMSVSSSFYQPRAPRSKTAASSDTTDSPPAAGLSKSLPHSSTSKGRAHYGRTLSSPGRGGRGGGGGGVVRNGVGGGVGVARSNSVTEGDVRPPRTLSYNKTGSELPSSSASSPGPSNSVKIPGQGGATGGNLTDRPPSVSYSYDGGFFVTANNAHKDFFVIDPEWVSEDGGTIQEEAEDGKGGASASGKTTTQGRGGGKAKPKVTTAAAAPGNRKNFKRSKSAPPSNLLGAKNPITWK